jgi:hypothetical protein
MKTTDLAFVETDKTALNRYKSERAIYRQLVSMKKELDEVKEKLSRVCDVIERIEKK